MIFLNNVHKRLSCDKKITADDTKGNKTNTRLRKGKEVKYQNSFPGVFRVLCGGLKTCFNLRL